MIDLIAFQAVMLLILISNILLLHSARKHSPSRIFPKVSILVPARNEEKNIASCIQSLLAQDYPSFEILALDDQSSDATRSILKQIASQHPELKVLVGSSPKKNQVGKNWACVQLAKQAQGDLLFFTDADTIHQPRCLRAMVTALMGEKADMLTGFPRQQLGSWGERLLVPFFSWASLCFNPLWLAYRLRIPVLSSAVGQMMMFRRDAYQSIGGHENLGSSVVDDLTLARKIKAAHLRWRVVHITDLVTCRMYHRSSEAFYGFTKNYFAAFGSRLLPYLFVFGWLLVLFLKPLIFLVLVASEQALPVQPLHVVVCIGLSLFLWWIPYQELRLPLGLALLYPVTILANVLVALQSLRLNLTGQSTWKNRKLAQTHWRWL